MTVPAGAPGALHIVATPIGNLEDITFRAVRVLREVSLIAAEDTRRSARLLGHYGIATRTVSYHEHNHRQRLPQLLERLRSGRSVALVTDAGTPGISDPGSELVAACLAQRIPVEPVPGVSASLTAAVASGFPLDPLTIFGFPPHRANDRAVWFEQALEIEHAFCFFEAPHRIESAIAELAKISGERQIVVARELTKIHEEFIRGSAREVGDREFARKGEFTVVVGPAQLETTWSDEEVTEAFGRLMLSGGYRSRRAAVAELARMSGRPARELYTLLEKRKHLAE
jgi:16S rRNA (cytidine1402-2'-O)-methyltransferase